MFGSLSRDQKAKERHGVKGCRNDRAGNHGIGDVGESHPRGFQSCGLRRAPAAPSRSSQGGRKRREYLPRGGQEMRCSGNVAAFFRGIAGDGGGTRQIGEGPSNRRRNEHVAHSSKRRSTQAARRTRRDSTGLHFERHGSAGARQGFSGVREWRTQELSPGLTGSGWF